MLFGPGCNHLGLNFEGLGLTWVTAPARKALLTLVLLQWGSQGTLMSHLPFLCKREHRFRGFARFWEQMVGALWQPVPR